MSWHLNPWEKVDKKNLIKALTEVKSLIKHYERYYPYVYKHIVPQQLHIVVSKLSSTIEKCENFCAWYTDIGALFEAIEELNKADPTKDPARATKAFGKLFIALSVLAMKIPNPIARSYAQVLKGFGENFERIVGTFSPDHGNKEYTESLRRFGQGRQDY